MPKQVHKDHYDFSNYVTKLRWASIWHQLDEVLGESPEVVLEVGPGPGIFKVLAELFSVKVETLDIDPELHPDHVGSAEALPFSDDSYDVACAFQVLEHVPYGRSLVMFKELCRVSKRKVVISLPDSRPVWVYWIHLPFFGNIKLLVPRPWSGPKKHVFNGQHYWEVSKKGFPLKKIVLDLERIGGGTLASTYRVNEFPYHRFFVFEVSPAS